MLGEKAFVNLCRGIGRSENRVKIRGEDEL